MSNPSSYVRASNGQTVQIGKLHLVPISQQICDDIYGCCEVLGIETPPLPQLGDCDVVFIPKLAVITNAILEAVKTRDVDQDVLPTST